MEKTIKVNEFVDKVNDMLANSTVEPEARKGIVAVADHFLHDTGNYYGFRYLRDYEVPTGHKPGINRNPDGTLPDIDTRFLDTDDTRIQFR